MVEGGIPAPGPISGKIEPLYVLYGAFEVILSATAVLGRPDSSSKRTPMLDSQTQAPPGWFRNCSQQQLPSQ